MAEVRCKFTIKSLIKPLVFLLILCVLFLGAQRLFQAKWLSGKNSSTSRWIEYKSLEEDTVDVIFIGTSHVYFAIDSMYIYENSGITSYVLAESLMRFDLDYLALVEAIKTQSPSVVMLDMSALHFGKPVWEAKAHRFLDNLSLSTTKIAYAFTNNNSKLPALDVIFPFFRYHTRWSDLNTSDINYLFGNVETTYLRGHYTEYTVKSAELRFYEDDGEDTECKATEYDIEYVKKIYELCEENGIELIMYKIPAPYWYQAQSDAAAELAEELGVYFWELTYEIEEMGIDMDTDWRDSTDHLNQLGAEKVSDYIMQYLIANYDLEDQRDTNTRWNEDLILYKAYLETCQ